MMMMKSVFWWRKPEYPEETTGLRQVTDEAFHTYGLCPVRGLNLGHSGVKQIELRRDEIMRDVIRTRGKSILFQSSINIQYKDIKRISHTTVFDSKKVQWTVT